MQKITKEEFERISGKGDNKKPIDELFEIKCKKCNCKGCVELFGNYRAESGYYDEIEADGKAVIKCHNCGNAKAIWLRSASAGWDGNYDLEKLE